jgi:hypothetical protein
VKTGGDRLRPGYGCAGALPRRGRLIHSPVSLESGSCMQTVLHRSTIVASRAANLSRRRPAVPVLSPFFAGMESLIVACHSTGCVLPILIFAACHRHTPLGPGQAFSSTGIFKRALNGRMSCTSRCTSFPPIFAAVFAQPKYATQLRWSRSATGVWHWCRKQAPLGRSTPRLAATREGGRSPGVTARQLASCSPALPMRSVIRASMSMQRRVVVDSNTGASNAYRRGARRRPLHSPRSETRSWPVVAGPTVQPGSSRHRACIDAQMANVPAAAKRGRQPRPICLRANG